jgi:hypothetical protein
MKNQSQIRRRYLVSAVAMAAVFSGGLWSLLAKATAAAPPDCTHANLLRLVPQEQAALVGIAVLLQLGHQTPQALVQSLATRLSGFLDGNLAKPCHMNDLHLAFQETVKADFAHGRCQSVDGWVLTSSELELCALAALS